MEHHVGYLDAANKEEQKKFLKHTFIVTPAIKKALDSNICFVCGRRGAGKTAFAAMIETIRKNDHFYFVSSIGLKDQDYSDFVSSYLNELFPIVSKHSDLDKAYENCYYHMWRYILHLLLFQGITKIKDAKISNQKEYATIYDYLKEENALGPAVHTARKKCRLIVDDAIKSSMPASYFIDSLEEKFYDPKFIAALDSVHSILEDYSLAVYVDSLEKYDTSGFVMHAIRGLCRAAKDLMHERRSSNFQIKCLLPAEVTHFLFTDNLAKYHEFSSFLLWRYSDLVKMMARRYCLKCNEEKLEDEILEKACVYFNDNDDISINDIIDNFWVKIAPKNINNKYGWAEPSCSYIIRHTQKRPREIISCMNYIIESAISYKSFPYLNEDAIRDGLHAVDNLWQLLSDNLAVYHYAPINKDLSSMAATVVVDENIIFSAKKLNNFCKRAFTYITDSTYKDVDYIKRLLIKSGLIGRIVKNKDNKIFREFHGEDGILHKYYITEFEYLIPDKVVIEDSSWCAVHPILADKLNLRNQSDDIGVVYPIPETNDIVSELNND